MDVRQSLHPNYFLALDHELPAWLCGSSLHGVVFQITSRARATHMRTPCPNVVLKHNLETK